MLRVGLRRFHITLSVTNCYLGSIDVLARPEGGEGEPIVEDSEGLVQERY